MDNNKIGFWGFILTLGLEAFTLIYALPLEVSQSGLVTNLIFYLIFLGATFVTLLAWSVTIMIIVRKSLSKVTE